MSTQQPMRRKGSCVAIWLGHFTDELELDEYLYSEFGREFGCQPEENNVPEYSVHQAPLPIRELLSGFSFAKDFLEAAVLQASQRGISTATSAVIYYQSEHDEGIAPTSAKMVFLGNITW